MASQRHRKIIQAAKGYKGRSKNCYTVAVRAVHRAWANRTRSRKLVKRDFAQHCVRRINAGARLYDMSYSKFMHGLKLAGVQLNRKALAEIAVYEPVTFRSLVDVSRAANPYPLIGDAPTRTAQEVPIVFRRAAARE